MVFAGLVSIAALGCGGVDEASTAESAIVGGSRTHLYPAVPLLKIVKPTGGTRSCSATLITPRILLTAAHCLDHEFVPQREYAYFGSRFTDPNDVDYVETIDIIHTEVVSGWALLLGNDVGLALLERAAVTPPLAFNRTPVGNSASGLPLTLVGWGRRSFDGPGAGTKRLVMSSLSNTGLGGVLMFGDASANVCQGDSGGPVFADINGQEVVIGVNSYITSQTNCTTGAAAAAVHRRLDFIDDFIEDFSPPTLQFVRPIAGAILPSGFEVEVEAAHPSGIDRVEVELDGTVIATLTQSPYVMSTPALNDGDYALSATVFSASGVSETTHIDVTVTSACSASNPCPEDHECVDGACVELYTGSFGEPCTRDADCRSERCLVADGVCSRACGASDMDCPDGFECDEEEAVCVIETEDDPDTVRAHPRAVTELEGRLEGTTPVPAPDDDFRPALVVDTDPDADPDEELLPDEIVGPGAPAGCSLSAHVASSDETPYGVALLLLGLWVRSRGSRRARR